MKNAYQKYKKTSIESAGREKLLLMLYEAAIKHLKLAIAAVEKRDIAGRALNIGKAFDIIMELNNTLDHRVGGEVAVNLEQLYIYIIDQLTQANIKSDDRPIRVCLKILETLYKGWVEAIEQLKSGGKGNSSSSGIPIAEET